MNALHARRTYDYRIQEAICESGDRELFPELNIPRSTIRSWIHRGTTDVVSCDLTDDDRRRLNGDEFYAGVILGPEPGGRMVKLYSYA